MPTPPVRDLTPGEIEEYDRDGVVCARGLFPDDWIGRMAAAIDRVVDAPSLLGNVVSMKDDNFSGDLFVWKTDDDFRDWIYESPAARVAQQVLRSKTVRHFYDQLFVKPPGCHVATPWHHDLTFWPIRGEQVCSIWMTFDPVTAESSGLEFVRGSHRWPNRYKAVSPMYNEQLIDPNHEDPPDIEAHRDEYDLVGWDVERGDMLIFHPLTLHGSSGNYHVSQPRRALAFRWCGDDAIYAPTPHTMPWRAPGLERGDRVAEPGFARIL